MVLVGRGVRVGKGMARVGVGVPGSMVSVAIIELEGAQPCSANSATASSSTANWLSGFIDTPLQRGRAAPIEHTTAASGENHPSVQYLSTTGKKGERLHTEFVIILTRLRLFNLASGF